MKSIRESSSHEQHIQFALIAQLHLHLHLHLHATVLQVSGETFR
jgi:hypothetical protein